MGVPRDQNARIQRVGEPGRGATIDDFMEWFHPVEESDAMAILEFVAQVLRNGVPDNRSI